jgi:hypothetical protein
MVNNRFALYSGGPVGKLIGHAESIDRTPRHVIDEAVLQVTRVIRTDLITVDDVGLLPRYRMPPTRICDVDKPTESFAGNASSNHTSIADLGAVTVARQRQYHPQTRLSHVMRLIAVPTAITVFQSPAPGAGRSAATRRCP